MTVKEAIGMKLFKKVLGPSQEEVWKQFADEIGAKFDKGSLVEAKKIVSKFDPWTITIDTYNQSIAGKVSIPYTRFTSKFINEDNFRFEIFKRNRLNDLTLKVGMQDINIGYRDFDEDFIIKGNDEEKIKELFSNDKIRELLCNQANIRLRINDRGWFTEDLPDGVDVLHLETNTVVKDINELRELYMIFVLVLNKLSLMVQETECLEG